MSDKNQPIPITKLKSPNFLIERQALRVEEPPSPPLSSKFPLDHSIKTTECQRQNSVIFQPYSNTAMSRAYHQTASRFSRNLSNKRLHERLLNSQAELKREIKKRKRIKQMWLQQKKTHLMSTRINWWVTNWKVIVNIGMSGLLLSCGKTSRISFNIKYAKISLHVTMSIFTRSSIQLKKRSNKQSLASTQD